MGTPVQVVDQLQTWFKNEAANGFNILPPMLPGSLDNFIDLVIPELQRLGLFRAKYEGKTLRENLGLARPESRPAARRRERRVLEGSGCQICTDAD